MTGQGEAREFITGKIMGQSQIIGWLEEHSNEWFTSEELQIFLGLSRSSANTCLRKIMKDRVTLIDKRKRLIERTGNNRTWAYEYHLSEEQP